MQEDWRLGNIEYLQYLQYNNSETVASQSDRLVNQVIEMDLRFPRIWPIALFARMFSLPLLIPAVAASMLRGSIAVNEAMALSMAVVAMLSAATPMVDLKFQIWQEPAYKWVAG